MKTAKITATKDTKVAPFGFKTIKVKAGETITADADNAEAWCAGKEAAFKPAKEAAEAKNAEPKSDNTKDATAKAEKSKKKAKED